MRAPRRPAATALGAAALGLGAAVAVAAGSAAGAGPARTDATAAARAATAGRARATGLSSGFGTQAVTSRAVPGADTAVATGRGPVKGFVESSVSIGSRVARARVQATGLSIFGGLVTARRVTVAATAHTGRAPAFAGSVAGLTAGGQAVSTAPGRRSAGGYGTLTVLRGGRGLAVTLTRPYGGYPAGSRVVVGEVAARAPRPAVPPPATTPGSVPTTSTATTPTTTRAAPAPPPAPPARPAPSPRARSRHAASPRHAHRVPRRRAPRVHAGLTGSGFAFPVYSSDAATADNFGAPREIGAHQGDDIFAPFGTPVVAVHDGRIGQVGTLPISGNRLWLHTASGAAFFYCHLSAFAPAAVNGAWVKAGTVLGFVGNTGDAEPTPPHLHFEIHPHGQEDSGAVDPYPILEAWQHRQDVPTGSWLTDTAERPGTLVLLRDFLAQR
jgi:murein DD-endopeptidase MepM/ murein hydrolase activator NlpD